MILERVGARRWIARIMISWGVLSVAMAFVVGPVSFALVRFLLGMAEAGFFPGIILYLTFWFPGTMRARIMGWFLVALPLSSIIGAPFSTWMLGTNLLGLRGWQSMFVLEGLPAILCGFLVWRLLPDRPGDATWLRPDESAAIERALASEAAPKGHATLMLALTSGRVWHLAVIYFGIVVGLYGFSFWAPQVIKSFGGLSNQQVGLVTVIPYVLAMLGMVGWSWNSDRLGERRWHIAFAAFAGAIGFTASAVIGDPVLKLAAFSFAAIGIYATLPVFWTLPTAFLSGTGAAAGIALINAIGNLGGYFGPSVIGALKERYGYGAGFLVLAVGLAVAGILALATPARTAVHQ